MTQDPEFMHSLAQDSEELHNKMLEAIDGYNCDLTLEQDMLAAQFLINIKIDFGCVDIQVRYVEKVSMLIITLRYEGGSQSCQIGLKPVVSKRKNRFEAIAEEI